MKVLFLGTPEFSAAILSALMRSKHTVAGVVTQPDRAVKRGKSEPSAVKKFALENGLTVFQPTKIRDEIDRIKQFGADIAVTAAYGQILNAAVLDAFPNGVINVHASLLPKYRGASPIQSAIANGERVTGVTIMKTELGIDTGDILAMKELEIGFDETAGSLTDRLSAMGAQLLVQTLDNFDDIVPVKQDDGAATYCKTIKKDELYIDFCRDASSVVNRIRSLSPSPCARTVIDGEPYKIYLAKVADCAIPSGSAPGEIVVCDKKLVIACADGGIEALNIQAPSKRPLDIADFLRGKRFNVGVICGSR